MRRFRNRYELLSVRSFEKSGDVDQQLVTRSLTALKESLALFNLEDQFNAGEFGLLYRRALDGTIA